MQDTIESEVSHLTAWCEHDEANHCRLCDRGAYVAQYRTCTTNGIERKFVQIAHSPRPDCTWEFTWHEVESVPA